MELLTFFLSFSLYRLCFRLVSFTWCLYPWAPAYSKETHQPGIPLLGWCDLWWVCMVAECSLSFTVKHPGWENCFDQNAVRSACNALFILLLLLLLQIVHCFAQTLCAEPKTCRKILFLMPSKVPEGTGGPCPPCKRPQLGRKDFWTSLFNSLKTLGFSLWRVTGNSSSLNFWSTKAARKKRSSVRIKLVVSAVRISVLFHQTVPWLQLSVLIISRWKA